MPALRVQIPQVDEALETISDLAIVIANYMERMVVEGHTGGVSDPISYWEELANNRAQLIVETLVKQGVRKNLLEARGEPGGGAKVSWLVNSNAGTGKKAKEISKSQIPNFPNFLGLVLGCIEAKYCK